MKKLTKNITISIITSLIIIFLHYVVYLDNTNIELWYIEWYANAPIDLPNIELTKEIRPTYLKPFQKLQYFYLDTNNQDNIIIAENQNFFKGNMTIIKWDDIVKKYHKESWYMFITPNVSNEYPSILFFFLQYILIFNLIFFTYKSLKEFKK